MMMEFETHLRFLSATSVCGLWASGQGELNTDIYKTHMESRVTRKIHTESGILILTEAQLRNFTAGMPYEGQGWNLIGSFRDCFL